jgi:N-formylglutamate deformylase
MNLFKIYEPSAEPVPIIVSVPHAGTRFPQELKKNFNRRMRRYLDDTDWYVHKLYRFASELGITVIKANLSRWVVDLNRDPESVPLYNDGRLITSITPTTDFFGNELYKSPKSEPDATEVQRRLDQYYWPYYHQIEKLLADRKAKFGKVLLWDAHSIRHLVSTIQANPFPDMILGNNDGKTASKPLIDSAIRDLSSGTFEASHNAPFKGGHITRYFGKPENDVHGLQLEMNKILYMDDSEITYNEKRARKVIEILRGTFQGLIKTLETV